MLSTVLPASPAADDPLARHVLAAQRGDREAFHKVAAAVQNLVCSITLAVVRDVPASEEVAQEVLVAMWSSLPRLRNPASFLPWVRQVARQRAHNRVRGWARARRRFHANGESALEQAVDPALAPDQRLVAAEERHALAEAIAALPDEAREIVVLFYREGRSVEQVASLLDLHESAVKKRLQRARDRLRADALDRLGERAIRSAPGAAFTAAVVGAIAAAAPSTAAATGVGLATKLSSGAKWAIVGAATLPGLIAGLIGIHVPLRTVLRHAVDEKERRQLRRIATLASVALVVFTSGIQVSLATKRAAYMIAGYVFLQVTFVALYGVWLPRVIRRRLQTQHAADPATTRRLTRQRRWSLLGLALGSVIAAIGVWQTVVKLRML